MPKFIPGLALTRDFYFDVVRPLIEQHCPGLQYSAGLVGHGSDVLGFDTPTSTDHDWGPYLHIFFADLDFIVEKNRVDALLRKHLPTSYKGFPTHFTEGDYYLKHQPKAKKRGPVNHIFRFWTIRSFFQHYLGFDISKQPSFRDWLLFPQQALIEVTGGQLYRDDLDVEKYRRQFAWYPDDIWKYLLHIQWWKIADEIQSPSRSGEEGDEVGSMVVTARTVQKIMFMCFLMERRYAPYSKWFGTAFQRWLRSGPELYPLLLQILHEKRWLPRQKLLTKAYRRLGEMHNALNLTPPVYPEETDFHGRGYPVLQLSGFFDGLKESIKNKKLKNMHYPLGAIDQFIDHAHINHMDYVYKELGDIIR
ncbi:MAG TPA: DUF4037 domain-containing protein [Candidatus Paceibacterota bacterium]|nr:DUF4037 domain-containing protein [Candidatus Paceibacterota bacterium]